MELVFLWVREHKNIRNTGFNFSPRFDCEYDVDTETLTIKGNQNTLNNFFGSNINITGVIGKNGTGKSSIISQALSWIDCFQVYYENGNLHLPESLKKSLTIKIDSELNINIIFDETLPEINSFLYSSDILNYKAEAGDYDSWFQVVPILGQNVLAKYLGYKESDFDSHSVRDLDLLYINIVLMTIDSINNPLNLPKFSFVPKVIKFQFFKPSIEKKDISDDGLDLEVCNKFLSLQDVETHSYKDTIENFINDGNYNRAIFQKLYQCGAFAVDLIDEKGVMFDELSQGERTIYVINLLIYNEIIKTGFDQPYLIFLDEPDLTLHPEWQKNYIYELHKTFDSFCVVNNIKIHFIITSHSPFLVSDIPNQNIIFLDKDKSTGECIVVDGLEKKETFGANIHTLLSDSFFMEGLIGKFAQNKIDELIKFLNGEESTIKNKEKAQELINIIGEPVIKRMLQQQLDSARLSIVDEMKRDIEELKKEIGVLKDDKN